MLESDKEFAKIEREESKKRSFLRQSICSEGNVQQIAGYGMGEYPFYDRDIWDVWRIRHLSDSLSS